MNDLTNVIAQARAAGLTAVYYTATTMAANGRYTLLTYDPAVTRKSSATRRPLRRWSRRARRWGLGVRS